jgi:tripeptidyl-peptidase I
MLVMLRHTLRHSTYLTSQPLKEHLTHDHRYNNSQEVRGYPDLSANGQDILIIFDEAWMNVDGTSASTPIVGGLISLINEQRKNVGKSTVGFINPVLYANPSALNDVVTGTNAGCSTNGFSAVSGWDPVTGLGTPDYQRLLTIWNALS